MFPQFRCRSCLVVFAGSLVAGDSSVPVCPACGTPGCAVPGTDLAAGTRVGGYEIRSLLGHGGMGCVYLASQLSLQRDVALKILHSWLAADRECTERFLQEARVAAQLNHPNIVTIYEAREEGGRLYLAMAYLRGSSLSETLQRDGALGEKDALRLGLKCCKALAYAYEKLQILHRDIKPANIMLEDGLEPVLLDMGLARFAGDQVDITASGQVLGTPAYMSPEQATGQPLDQRSDIYSLGATLYHAVTGQPPFSGDSATLVISKMLREPAVPAAQVNSEISARCSQLLERMMARDPDQRIADWGLAGEEIDAAVRGKVSRRSTRVAQAAAVRRHLERARGVHTPKPRLAPRDTSRPVKREGPLKLLGVLLCVLVLLLVVTAGVICFNHGCVDQRLISAGHNAPRQGREAALALHTLR